LEKTLFFEEASMPEPVKIVLLGASGAVGGEALKALLARPQEVQVTALGRRALDLEAPNLRQGVIDVSDPASYRAHLEGHRAAICALGVGQPSQMSREEFLRIDRDAVLAFGGACRAAGVRHFSLLASVGANAQSRSFYLRSKGQTEEGLRALGFEGLSLFEPSMILTPTNRYGLSQAVVLRLWPLIDPLLWGPWRKFRGVRVADLGRAMALDALRAPSGERHLSWDDFRALNGAS
jgi:uncharacterized protein YbjT (DUF2867 family)